GNSDRDRTGAADHVPAPGAGAPGARTGGPGGDCRRRGGPRAARRVCAAVPRRGGLARHARRVHPLRARVLPVPAFRVACGAAGRPAVAAAARTAGDQGVRRRAVGLASRRRDTL
ncbi:MAG: hypothetical protein AVDCRST_MAG88-1798, partial [uncultured Thermomicrobiales bacterium]